VAADGSELIGRNGSGEDVFQHTVEDRPGSGQIRDSSFIHAARLGKLLFVSLGRQIVALDARPSEQGGESGLLWQANPMGGLSVDLAAKSSGLAGRRGSVYDAFSGRRRASSAVGPVMGSLGPVMPNGVVFQDQDNLKCVDPLTGETLWSRSNVPDGCELFGDQELVYAADVHSRVAKVFRMIDGQPLGERKLPDIPWMLTAGRNVAQSGVRGLGSERTMYLRVTDIESQRVLFEADYDDQTRMTTIEPRSVAIYEPSGKFQLVDVGQGRERIDQQLTAMSESPTLHTLISGRVLFLMISTRSTAQQSRSIASTDYPLIHGLVYAFDLDSGEPLWSGPALVRNRGIALGQPTEIPLLVFVDRKMTRDGNAGGGSRTRILCLDKRTGQTIYRNDDLPNTSATQLRIRALQSEAPTVSVAMNEAQILLSMSDRPRPPQPPADDDLEIPRSSAERGLWGVAGRMGSALQSALEAQPEDSDARDKANPTDEDSDAKTGEVEVDDD
jgi:outer membrane protein assembly factor BamB